MKYIFVFSIASLALMTACGGNESVRQQSTPEMREKTPETRAPKPADEQDNAALSSEPKDDVETRKVTAENKIMDQIWDIPEVTDLDKTVRQKSKGKRGVSTFIAGEPSDDQEYYLVSVAEDNGEAYATYFQFCVYPDYSVRFYDVVNDEIISLKEWRRRQSEEGE